MTSHRAPPELNGFGNTTSTPDFTRSSQVWMCFGLPFLSTKTTTDFETMPWYAFLSHALSTRPAETRRSTSVEIEKFTTSAGKPAGDGFLVRSGAADVAVQITPLTFRDFVDALMQIQETILV